jgi:hypothetical protein
MTSVQRAQQGQLADVPTPERPAAQAPTPRAPAAQLPNARAQRAVRADRPRGTAPALQPPAARGVQARPSARDLEFEEIQNMHQHGKIQAAMCNGGYLPPSECQ